jgi:transposase
MKRGKEVLKGLWNFEGFSFEYIFKEKDIMIIRQKKKGKTGICPVCKKKRRKVIEVRERTIRDENISRKKCFILLKTYRILCKGCYRGMEKLDFILPGERFTERFAKHIYELCEKMTLKDVAKECMINWRTAKRIDKKKLKEKFKDLKKVSPKRIGVDEIAQEKGHKYLTIVRDLDKGVIWVGVRRRKETLDEFFNELGKRKCKKISVAVIDMWDPYIKSIKENTNAEIVFDRFHISKKINEAVDNLRKREFTKASKEERIEMKHKRFLLLYRNKNLDKEQEKDLDELMEQNKNLYKAYLLKEQALNIFERKQRNVALRKLENWKKNVHESKMKEFTKLLKTLEHYWYGIENYFTYHVTNGASEGYNNKINIIKRRAYGFKDIEYFKLKILQSCS